MWLSHAAERTGNRVVVYDSEMRPTGVEFGSDLTEPGLEGTTEPGRQNPFCTECMGNDSMIYIYCTQRSDLLG